VNVDSAWPWLAARSSATASAEARSALGYGAPVLTDLMEGDGAHKE
jgi:hypothetical protein